MPVSSPSLRSAACLAVSPGSSAPPGEFPSGCYHQAHYHGGGAIFINVGGGTGYTMMWPQEVGPHPYSGGHEDQIVRVNWQDGSLYSPPSGWFHQHFNTGEETVRQLALGLGSHRHRVTFHEAISGEGTLVSIKDGGSLVTYADEDPEISRRFKKELAGLGIEYQMDRFSPTETPTHAHSMARSTPAPRSPGP